MRLDPRGIVNAFPFAGDGVPEFRAAVGERDLEERIRRKANDRAVVQDAFVGISLMRLSRLKHEVAAAAVIDERLQFRRVLAAPVEERAEPRAHRRLRLVARLGNDDVQDRRVHALVEELVGDRLERGERPLVRLGELAPVAGRERLGIHLVLAARARRADGVADFLNAVAPRRPELRRHLVRRRAVGDAVHHGRTVGVGFAPRDEAVFMGASGERPDVFARDEFSAKRPQILLAAVVGVVEVVAETCLEPIKDVIRVVLRPALPRIDDERRQRRTLRCRDAPQDFAEERIEVLAHMLRGELVHLVARRLGAARRVHRGQPLALAADLPADAVRGVVVAHRLFRLHPRPARLRPARAVEDAHFDAEFARDLERRPEAPPPVLAHELVFAVDEFLPFRFAAREDVRRIADVRRQERAGDAVRLHPFEVLANALFVHALVHPIVVAPDLHLGRRIDKILVKPRPRHKRPKTYHDDRQLQTFNCKLDFHDAYYTTPAPA